MKCPIAEDGCGEYNLSCQGLCKQSYSRTNVMLEKWFNHKAKLLAQQLPKKYPTNDIEFIPWVLSKRELETDMATVAPGIKAWLNSIHEIEYISIRSGMEANYLVFLTINLDKFHETYLCE